MRHRHLVPQRRGLGVDGATEQAGGGHRQCAGLQRAKRLPGDGPALGHLGSFLSFFCIFFVFLMFFWILLGFSMSSVGEPQLVYIPDSE